MHIYYEQNFFRSNSKEELIGFTEFLSNTGGLLGLFLGFSVVSLIEIIYFLTLRPYCARKRQKDNEQNLTNLQRNSRRKRAANGSVQFQRNKLFGQIKRKELALFRPEIYEANSTSIHTNRYQYFEWNISKILQSTPYTMLRNLFCFCFKFEFKFCAKKIGCVLLRSGKCVKSCMVITVSSRYCLLATPYIYYLYAWYANIQFYWRFPFFFFLVCH